MNACKQSISLVFVLNLWMMTDYGIEDENGSNEHKLENTH